MSTRHRIKMRARPLDVHKRLLIKTTDDINTYGDEAFRDTNTYYQGGLHKVNDEEIRGGGGIYSTNIANTGSGNSKTSASNAFIPTPPIRILEEYDKKTYKKYVPSRSYIKFHLNTGACNIHAGLRYTLQLDDMQWLQTWNNRCINEASSAANDNTTVITTNNTNDNNNTGNQIIPPQDEDSQEILLSKQEIMMNKQCYPDFIIDPNYRLPMGLAVASQQKQLPNISTYHLEGVYGYWRQKRLQLGKALLRQFQAPPAPDNPSPHVAFRPRQQGRRVSHRHPRKNDALAYHKMRLLRRNFYTVQQLLDLIKRREIIKLNIILIDSENFDTQIQSTNFGKYLLTLLPNDSIVETGNSVYTWKKNIFNVPLNTTSATTNTTTTNTTATTATTAITTTDTITTINDDNNSSENNKDETEELYISGTKERPLIPLSSIQKQETVTINEQHNTPLPIAKKLYNEKQILHHDTISASEKMSMIGTGDKQDGWPIPQPPNTPQMIEPIKTNTLNDISKQVISSIPRSTYDTQGYAPQLQKQQYHRPPRLYIPQSSQRHDTIDMIDNSPSSIRNSDTHYHYTHHSTRSDAIDIVSGGGNSGGLYTGLRPESISSHRHHGGTSYMHDTTNLLKDTYQNQQNQIMYNNIQKIIHAIGSSDSEEVSDTEVDSIFYNNMRNVITYTERIGTFKESIDSCNIINQFVGNIVHMPPRVVCPIYGSGGAHVTTAVDTNGSTVNAVDTNGSTVNAVDTNGSTVNAVDTNGNTVNAVDTNGNTINAVDANGNTVNAVDTNDKTILKEIDDEIDDIDDYISEELKYELSEELSICERWSNIYSMNNSSISSQPPKIKQNNNLLPIYKDTATISTTVDTAAYTNTTRTYWTAGPVRIFSGNTNVPFPCFYSDIPSDIAAHTQRRITEIAIYQGIPETVPTIVTSYQWLSDSKSRKDFLLKSILSRNNYTNIPYIPITLNIDTYGTQTTSSSISSSSVSSSSSSLNTTELSTFLSPLREDTNIVSIDKTDKIIHPNHIFPIHINIHISSALKAPYIYSSTETSEVKRKQQNSLDVIYEYDNGNENQNENQDSINDSSPKRRRIDAPDTERSIILHTATHLQNGLRLLDSNSLYNTLCTPRDIVKVEPLSSDLIGPYTQSHPDLLSSKSLSYHARNTMLSERFVPRFSLGERIAFDVIVYRPR